MSKIMPLMHKKLTILPNTYEQKHLHASIIFTYTLTSQLDVEPDFYHVCIMLTLAKSILLEDVCFVGLYINYLRIS